MVNPNNVELLIFDLDGTIFQSDVAVFEILKKITIEMNLDFQISKEKIKNHLGESSEDFYKNILPLDKRSLWEGIRRKVGKEYSSTFKEFACLFSDVLETLETLKKRDYKLALYSNASLRYFNTIISTFNLKELFDYLECNEENNLTKIELVKKIKNLFPELEATVIGDKIHDIEAARKNNILSIGALYGYGGQEIKQADITINKFSDLLNIFDRKLPIFEKILGEIKKRKQKEKAFVVGINGIDTSGKTKFAEAFGKFLKSENYKIQAINLDDFHNPKQIRYSGENQAENYYNKSFDIETIIKKLLIPIHQKSSFSTKLTLLDLHTDKYEVEKEFSFDQNTIVIFEGVFLFRKELSQYVDYKIFVEVSFDKSKGRAEVRDVPIYGEEVLKKYDEKYLPAQKKYLEEFPPSKIADMMVDNNNWEFPKIVSFNNIS